MVTNRQALCGLLIVAAAATYAAQKRSGVTAVTASSEANSKTVTRLSASRRPSENYYMQLLSGGMFGEKTAAYRNPAPSRIRQRTRSVPLSSPSENPLTDYAFTGIMNVQGRTTALIENTKTREGLFVGIGDRFLHGKITGIDEQRITLVMNQTKLTLSRFSNYRLTPLDSSAPFLRGGGGASPVPPQGTPPGSPNPVGVGTPPIPLPMPAAGAQEIPGGVPQADPKVLENIPPLEVVPDPPPIILD